ncbi:hypothetical protein PB1_05255 [Bacillus methanolicus PB1]|uniref:Uncharacterized protein n=1 Tax=Bacillus methanolicus PB1 TaxID=997296 RepID=I3E738_BACMT|nr:hypothetical protein PB1_05255 [Bacillus methanolicus PB1]
MTDFDSSAFDRKSGSEHHSKESKSFLLSKKCFLFLLFFTYKVLFYLRGNK